MIDEVEKPPILPESMFENMLPVAKVYLAAMVFAQMNGFCGDAPKIAAEAVRKFKECV
jgi:hypothetical protein